MVELRSYRLVRNRSRLWAEVRATLQQIQVEATDFDGHFELPQHNGRLAAGAVKAGRFTVSAQGLEGNNLLFNRDLARTIEVRKFPQLVGDLEEIVSGPGPDEMLMRGTLRLRGAQSAVEGRIRVDYPDARHVRLQGGSQFDIESHGIRPRRLIVLSVERVVRFFGDVVLEAV